MEDFDEHHKAVVATWWQLHAQIRSANESAIFLQSHYGMYARHPTSSDDRLCREDIPFPIGICFGDRDMFGSAGADAIVKKSKFFESGES